jgi:glycosyltransferase involved in cell wall biosynthesis
VPWVLWHQDIWSAAMGDEARRRWPQPLAGAVARGFDRLEAWCARRASRVVAIGDEFTKVYPRWGVDSARVAVIPNWAPLNDIVPTERDGAQADVVFGPERRPESLRLLYAGSLGRKHNPLLLVELLRAVRRAGVDAVLSVVSEGEAAADVQAAADADPDLPLRVLPFQPSEQLAATLGSADILVALLEPEATAFSIPSKVLSYMAAGRPIIGLMPDTNPAAVDITDCGGFVAEPTVIGVEAVAKWIASVADSPDVRATIGRSTRKLAEDRFDPDRITDRFEAVLRAAVLDGRS